MDCKRCILCQRDSSAPLLYPSRNRDDTVCEYVNLKNKIEEFQKEAKFRFLLESLCTETDFKKAMELSNYTSFLRANKMPLRDQSSS